jgi:hypothetical protein
MTTFQYCALGPIALWLTMVLVPILEGLSDRGPGGNRPIDAGCLATGRVSRLEQRRTVNYDDRFCARMARLGWACRLLAHRIATYLVREPPTLDAFDVLQQSRIMPILGIVVAWIPGGFLEERSFRAILLHSVESVSALLAAAVAAGIAAAGPGVIHLYQGLRAATIMTSCRCCSACCLS